MADHSHIEWTEATWNPVTGCSKVSAGCKNCYAERMAKRLRAMGVERYRNGFDVTLHPDLLGIPKEWKSPRTIFVNSMSDLFHERVPLTFIQRVFSTIRQCSHHTFQILTKRSDRLVEVCEKIDWPHNAWMGVSVENADVLYRVDDLRQVPSSVRFLSCEPLIGPLDGLDLRGINWVIVGGESGPRCRPLEVSWIRGIHREAKKNNVAFFFKQWGGTRKSRSGRLLDGRTYDEMPVPLSV